MEILLFGIAREIAGTGRLTLPDGPQPENVAALRTWLGDTYPRLRDLRSLAVAVDREYAGDEVLLGKDSEVALIPPVSGG